MLVTMSSLMNRIDRIHERIFFGWWIVIVGAVINAVGIGVVYHGFTVFFLPLKRELALSSAAISLVYGACRLEGGLEGPLVGYLINKFGPKKLIFFGSALTGIGFLFFSRINSYTMFFIAYVLVISLGASAGFFHPISTVVNNWFIRKRGTAFGFITAAASFGGMVFVPMLSHLTLQYSWRIAAFLSGIAILALCLPLASFMHLSPEERGLEPDGGTPPNDSPGTSDSAGTTHGDVDYKVKEALKTSTFWLLSLCISLRIMVTIALAAHMIPILVWKGMEEASAAYLVSLANFLTIIGMVLMGWIGDRFYKPHLISVSILATMICLLWPVISDAGFTSYLIPIGLAVTMSTVPLNWSLIGDFFGRENYAPLRGITVVGVGIATFVSPIYAGWIFDFTQSYAITLMSFSAVFLLAAIMFAVLRRPVLRR